jgi:3'-5' exoribonuclease
MREFEIDDDIKDKLLHIIVSHHGNNEFGSPKEPMFPEAVAVYYADEMSSKLAEITEYIEDNKNDTEDEFQYHYKKGRNIFLR